MEARQAEASRDWPRAIEAYGALFGFFPDNLEYGLRLARVQANSGRAPDALGTVDTLRALPPPAGSDPRIDLLEAVAASSVGDYRRGRSAAERGAARADEMGARLIAADARIQEGWASQRLGRRNAPCRCSRRPAAPTPRSGSRPGSHARSCCGAACPLRERGRAEARRLYEEALATFRETGDQRSIGSVLNDLGNLQYNHGDLAGARRLLRADLRDLPGDRKQDRARGIVRQHREHPRQPGRPRGSAQAARGGGRAVPRGEATRAASRARSSISASCSPKRGSSTRHASASRKRSRCTAKRATSAGSATSLRAWAISRWRRTTCRRRAALYQESLALREELGEKENAAINRMLLAQLAVEEGKPGDGVQLAREAAGVFAAQGQRRPGVRGAGGPLLGPSSRKASRARRSPRRDAPPTWRRGARARGHAHRRERRCWRAPRRRRGTRGGRAPPRSSEALAEAGRYGLVPQQLEARLARGEIALRGEPAVEAAAQLAALERDARAAGFARVARKAAELGKTEKRN